MALSDLESQIFKEYQDDVLLAMTNFYKKCENLRVPIRSAQAGILAGVASEVVVFIEGTGGEDYMYETHFKGVLKLKEKLRAEKI